MSERFGPAARGLSGVVRAPADKSISHRAALLAAMGEGTVRIGGYLRGADTLATLDAVRALGADVRDDGDAVFVGGVGLRGAREPAQPIDVRNAGTLLRLLPGWLAGQAGRSFTLDGDESIRRRPVDRIAAPLRLMGASIEAREGRLPPVRVDGGPLHGIRYELPVASAQVKSARAARRPARRGRDDRRRAGTEPRPHRADARRDGRRAAPRRRLRHGAPAGQRGAARHGGPGDPSSAAFWIAAALLVPGSELRIDNVAANWTRCGFVEIARRMGGRVEGDVEPPGGGVRSAGEPVTALTVRASPLRATAVGGAEVPLAIDELPLVALLGCFAEGETVVRGAAELRLKESDRIATVVEGLRGLGGQIEGTADGFVVTGTGGLRGGVLHSHGDHRLAMLGAVAGLASRDGVEVVDFAAAGVSYPGFGADLAQLAP